eukprot:749435-Hanusia_phi.AAC.2
MLSPRSFWSYRKESSKGRSTKNKKRQEDVGASLQEVGGELEETGRAERKNISRSELFEAKSTSEHGESFQANFTGSDGTVSDGEDEELKNQDLFSRLSEAYQSTGSSRRPVKVSSTKPVVLHTKNLEDKFTWIQELTLSRRENDELRSKSASMEEKVMELQERLAGAEHREKSMRSFIRELREINKALQDRVTFLEETMDRISMRDQQWQRICDRMQVDLNQERDRRMLLESVFQMVKLMRLKMECCVGLNFVQALSEVELPVASSDLSQDK